MSRRLSFYCFTDLFHNDTQVEFPLECRPQRSSADFAAGERRQKCLWPYSFSLNESSGVLSLLLLSAIPTDPTRAPRYTGRDPPSSRAPCLVAEPCCFQSQYSLQSFFLKKMKIFAVFLKRMNSFLASRDPRKRWPRPLNRMWRI